MAAGPSRLGSIQRMRGWGALTVVLGHTVYVINGLEDEIGHSYIGHFGHTDLWVQCMVDLFFVISGFVMALSVRKLSGWSGAKNFMVMRFVRISPVYLVTTALVIPMTYYGDRVWPSWRSIYNWLLYVPIFDWDDYSEPPLVVGWTLSFEFVFYAMVAVMVIYGLNNKLVWLVPLVTATSIAGAFVSFKPFILTWLLNPIMSEFGIGIIAYVVWQKGWLQRRRALWVIGGLLACAALAYELVTGFGVLPYNQLSPPIPHGTMNWMRPVYWGIPMFFVFCWLAGGKPPTWAPRSVAFFSFLGDASLSIYLAHKMVLKPTGKLIEWGTLPIPSFIPADVLLVAMVVAGTLWGVIVYLLVEKPVTARLRPVAERWLNRTSREPAALPATATT